MVVERLRRHHHESVTAAPVWFELIHGVEQMPTSHRLIRLAQYLQALNDSDCKSWAMTKQRRIGTPENTRGSGLPVNSGPLLTGKSRPLLRCMVWCWFHAISETFSYSLAELKTGLIDDYPDESRQFRPSLCGAEKKCRFRAVSRNRALTGYCHWWKKVCRLTVFASPPGSDSTGAGATFGAGEQFTGYAAGGYRIIVGSSGTTV